MRLLHVGLIVAMLGVSVVAAPPKKVHAKLTAVDAGAFTFLGPTSATVAGDGFEKQGNGLNNRVSSSGQFDLLGPANKCASGFTGRLVGTFVEANSADTFSYTIDNQLCPTGEANIYSASGTYEITGGTGKYAEVKGGGQFEGMADFGRALYKCLLDGSISY